MNPKVDFYFINAKNWQEELLQLRLLVLDCGLTEELKWGVPCYQLEKNNLVLLHVFKDYCALLFFKGALMKDPNNILIQQTKNVQAGRQIRFTSVKQIVEMLPIVKIYIDEAIAVEKAGLKISFKPAAAYPVPEEFTEKFKDIPALKTAFDALTPGRQKAYLFYFSAPKQAKTREARIAKFIQQILNGKGLND